ncbi:MAG TPA: hypothetical protein VJU86_19525 [Pyrinomonadaceae bacterium]|nr:hypothetical protein [Pyrinomonadaceae bacterium]
MKRVLSYQCALAALIVVLGAFSFVKGQTASATPDPFVSQITASGAGGLLNPFITSAGDITANGRFVVFESNGNVATQNRNNADGNRELFLFDYVQRRIFQLTNTRNVLKPPASPSPTPTPSPSPSPTASPTPTPGPTPADTSLVAIEISNNRPMISAEPILIGGQRFYTIVFSSNAPNPANFDGTGSAALSADANQEVWIYLVPGVTDQPLTTGDEFAFIDLSVGGFRQITNSTASRAPVEGSFGVLPFIADDNREATISDNGDIIAFISTRSLIGTGNTDGNPELFLASRTATNWSTFSLVQATTTQDEFVGPKLHSRFQQNPSLSANGSVVAFLSSANLSGNNSDDGSGHGNAEVYVADYTGSAVTNIRQVTRTKTDATAATVNILSPGRRLSRDGQLIAFESLAEDPKANTTTNSPFYGIFVYTISGDSMVRVGPRAAELPGDVIRFPGFTDYNAALSPSTLVFSSALNFKADGTFPAADAQATGLNPGIQPQIFSTQIPFGSSSTFTRLTRNPIGSFGGIRPLTSATRTRITFSLSGSDLGDGNGDRSSELFYLLTPTVTTESAAVLSFFTGASNFPVATATPAPSPAPSPAPTPTPTPTPGTIAGGLSAGELSIVRSTVALAPIDKNGAGGSETDRRPILPIELAGVSVSVNGVAAGLYFVGESPAEGINFVMPPSLAAGVATVVVNNNGTTYRGFVQVLPSQPDLFTSTNGELGVALICNVTNPTIPGCVTGPFPLMSPDSTGTLVPTVLEIYLTGVRGVTVAETRVTIGTTDITPNSVTSNPNMYGFDLIRLTLPSTLTPGTYPVIVTVTKSGTFQSRAAATAPSITIAP